MRVLAIDTSTHVSSVALLRDGELRYQSATDVGIKHGELLLPRIEQGLQQQGWTMAELSLVACGVGPGSFTGLRVGLATAKGLALALGTPLRGVISLQALALGAAAAAPAHGLVAPVIDAYRGEVFLAVYRLEPDGTLVTLLEPCNATPIEACTRLRAAAGGEPLTLCGNGLQRHRQELSDGLDPTTHMLDESHAVPLGEHIGRLGQQALLADGPSDAAALEPLYIRDSDAKLPSEPLAL